MKRETITAFTISLCVCLITFSGAITGSYTQASGDDAAVSAMPGVIVLGSISDKFEPVTFDHAEHVDMADRCGDCHHQHGTEKTLSCRKCHEIDPSAFQQSAAGGSFSPCKTCHAESFQPGKLNMPGLKAAYHRACFSCHRDVSGIGGDPKGCTELCHERREEAAGRMD
ncbi:MAG: hypothetical protein GTN70_00135 [Deltaproteobacteria bacterium]|nr:hypothetical protein [Deltaproteobacteria bacterium]NIS76068.1 hypothetical protein [Deltaproteobacteria bacterium]